MIRMSFTGVKKNALDALEVMSDRLIIDSKDDMDADDAYNDAGSVKTCISVYHDTILALVRGDATLDEVKDFFFHGVNPNNVNYMGDILKVNK